MGTIENVNEPEEDQSLKELCKLVLEESTMEISPVQLNMLEVENNDEPSRIVSTPQEPPKDSNIIQPSHLNTAVIPTTAYISEPKLNPRKNKKLTSEYEG